MLRVSLALALIAATIVVPFLIWGGDLEAALSVDQGIVWLRGTGWAWAAGVGLIAADIFLPVPSKPVMAALGILYGPLLGGALSAAGSILAGCAGYGLCRLLPARWSARVIGPDAMASAHALFDRWGFAIIALSRWLPVLPELVTFVAGLTRLSFPRFFLALCAGSIPLGFLVATAAYLGRETPLLVLVLSAALPVLIWLGLRLMRRTR